jgi:hypothetical protein
MGVLILHVSFWDADKIQVRLFLGLGSSTV